MNACRDNNAARTNGVASRERNGPETVIVTVQCSDLVLDKLRTVLLYLRDKALRKVEPAHLRAAGIVFYLRGVRDLTARYLLLRNYNALFSPAAVERGGESCGTCTDRENIIYLIHARSFLSFVFVRENGAVK